MRHEEEHHKIAAAYRPKQDKKRAEASQKRAAKRPKMEMAQDNKVLGKRKADFDQDDVKADNVMGERRQG